MNILPLPLPLPLRAPARRALLAATIALAGLVTLPAWAEAPRAPDVAKFDPATLDPAKTWVGTWGTAPAGPPLPAALQTFTDQTVRLIVHTSIGGSGLRIRLSNELGSTPLRIGAAHVALRGSGADIVPGSDRALTFGGRPFAVIPAGAPILSDPVDLDVAGLADLAISLHLPGTAQATTIHGSAFQVNYASEPGDHTGAASFPIQRTLNSWPFLTGVDVVAPGAAAIVALGDSITDGSVTTTGANRRWPDLLAQRLQTTRTNAQDVQDAQGVLETGTPPLVQWNARLGIVNRGIGGNRLLNDPGTQPLFGKAALARFDRDVLATSGVRHVVLLIGINDIGHPGTGSAPASEAPTPEDLMAGYRQVIERAHARGIAVYGATLTPFEGTTFAGYYTPAKEAVRQAVNSWIRSSDAFDGVIDFDQAVRDPDRPARMLAKYDSGDHLHPNDLGMQAMANAIPLTLFRGAPAAVAQAKR